MSSDHLILDLDGTISDPSVGIFRSINYALEGFGYPPICESRISAYIGPPIDLTFRSLTQTTSEEHIHALVGRFRERYADIGYSENALYPGVADALQTLAQAGARLGLCTSKRVDFAERILSMFGLRPHFDLVSGGDVGISKASQLADLLREGLVGAGSTMIGDRAVDVQAGKASGLYCIGVLWGHGSESELVDAGADRIFTHPLQLGSLADAV